MTCPHPSPAGKIREAIVIGAGPGGLASALLLSRQGFQVNLLERNRTTGGKMQEVCSGPYRFDTGPSLLTLPGVMNDLLTRIGVPPSTWPECIEMSPLCRYFYRDGKQLDAYRQRERMEDQIRAIAPGDVEGYRDFLHYAETLYDRTADAFLYNPLYSRQDLKRLNLLDLLKIDALRTVSKAVDSYLHSDYMRMFFKRFATYNGSTPFKAPATLNVIPHVELTLGGYYLRGGLYRFVELLEREAKRAGVRIRTDCTVTRIETRDGEVRAVHTAGGERIGTSVVISNADAAVTLSRMLDREAQKGWRDWILNRQEPSSSGFVMLLGCNRSWERLSHHNIFFGEDYRKEFREIFQESRVPADPTVYVTNTSVTDPGDAPDGGSNLFVLINVPIVTGETDWSPEIADRLGSRLIRRLEESGLVGLSDSVEFKQFITPSDLAYRYETPGGSIYGSSSNSRLSAFMRPANKVREVEGLYLAGGSAHPGGGVPLVLLSAMHAAELVSRYEV